MAWDKGKTCILKNLSHKLQRCVMKMKKVKKKWLPITFCTKKVKFDRWLQKSIGTDNTSSIKAWYNEGINTIVIT